MMSGWASSGQSAAVNDPMGLLIRSVGPAGGPLSNWIWDCVQLIVNHRWVVGFGDVTVPSIWAMNKTPAG